MRAVAQKKKVLKQCSDFSFIWF